MGLDVKTGDDVIALRDSPIFTVTRGKIYCVTGVIEDNGLEWLSFIGNDGNEYYVSKKTDLFGKMNYRL